MRIRRCWKKVKGLKTFPTREEGKRALSAWQKADRHHELQSVWMKSGWGFKCKCEDCNFMVYLQPLDENDVNGPHQLMHDLKFDCHVIDGVKVPHSFTREFWVSPAEPVVFPYPYTNDSISLPLYKELKSGCGNKRDICGGVLRDSPVASLKHDGELVAQEENDNETNRDFGSDVEIKKESGSNDEICGNKRDVCGNVLRDSPVASLKHDGELVAQEENDNETNRDFGSDVEIKHESRSNDEMKQGFASPSNPYELVKSFGSFVDNKGKGHCGFVSLYAELVLDQVIDFNEVDILSFRKSCREYAERNEGMFVGSSSAYRTASGESGYRCHGASSWLWQVAVLNSIYSDGVDYHKPIARDYWLKSDALAVFAARYMVPITLYGRQYLDDTMVDYIYHTTIWNCSDNVDGGVVVVHYNGEVIPPPVGSIVLHYNGDNHYIHLSKHDQNRADGVVLATESFLYNRRESPSQGKGRKGRQSSQKSSKQPPKRKKQPSTKRKLPSKKVDSELAKPFKIPRGFNVRLSVRKSGKTAGSTDKYYSHVLLPNREFRSVKEVDKFIRSDEGQKLMAFVSTAEGQELLSHVLEEKEINDVESPDYLGHAPLHVTRLGMGHLHSAYCAAAHCGPTPSGHWRCSCGLSNPSAVRICEGCRTRDVPMRSSARKAAIDISKKHDELQAAGDDGCTDADLGDGAFMQADENRVAKSRRLAHEGLKVKSTRGLTKKLSAAYADGLQSKDPLVEAVCGLALIHLIVIVTKRHSDAVMPSLVAVHFAWISV